MTAVRDRAETSVRDRAETAVRNRAETSDMSKDSAVTGGMSPEERTDVFAART